MSSYAWVVFSWWCGCVDDDAAAIILLAQIIMYRHFSYLKMFVNRKVGCDSKTGRGYKKRLSQHICDGLFLYMLYNFIRMCTYKRRIRRLPGRRCRYKAGSSRRERRGFQSQRPTGRILPFHRGQRSCSSSLLAGR